MARHRRNTAQELNFDGLADSVTNLVGALILLILLVIGMTRPATPKIVALPPAPPLEASHSGDKSMAPLMIELNRLRSDVDAESREVQRLESLIDQFDQEIQELSKGVQSKKAPMARSVPERLPATGGGA